jgi:hypothetical protein
MAISGGIGCSASIYRTHESNYLPGNRRGFTHANAVQRIDESKLSGVVRYILVYYQRNANGALALSLAILPLASARVAKANHWRLTLSVVLRRTPSDIHMSNKLAKRAC